MYKHDTDLHEKRLSKSNKLRKYGSAYKSYIRKNGKIQKSPRKQRDTPENVIIKTIDSKPKKKILNPYQKFVKSESRKDVYKDIPGKERLTKIAIEWKSHKKL